MQFDQRPLLFSLPVAEQDIEMYDIFSGLQYFSE